MAITNAEIVKRAEQALGNFEHGFNQAGLLFIGRRLGGSQADFTKSVLTALTAGKLKLPQAEQKRIGALFTPTREAIGPASLTMLLLGRYPRYGKGGIGYSGKPIPKGSDLDTERGKLSRRVTGEDRVYAIQYKRAHEAATSVEGKGDEQAPATKPEPSSAKRPATGRKPGNRK